MDFIANLLPCCHKLRKQSLYRIRTRLFHVLDYSHSMVPVGFGVRS